ncbi:MAG: hypothetical protein JXA96_02800 [Sedimentisphaerales bacterium]|nr:hypothetical protein [Sedimentisphaerales bacterium]
MSFFKIKENISIEQLCQEFYDSVVFYESNLDDKLVSGFQNNSLEFVSKDIYELTSVNCELVKQEINSLCLELFSLAFVERMKKQNEEYHMFESMCLIRQIKFTHKYLMERGRLDIWNNMLVYNKAIGDNLKINLFTNSVVKWINDGIDQTYANSAANLMSTNTRRILDNIDCFTTIFAERLGIDIEPDSKTSVAIQWLILNLFSKAKAHLEMIIIETNGMVKNRPWELVKSIGFGMVWIIIFGFFILDSTSNKLSMVIGILILLLFCSPGIYIVWSGLHDLRRLWRLTKGSPVRVFWLIQ